MRGLPALVTFMALLAPARGGPLSSVWNDNDSQCAKACVASNKFQYARDTTYEFDYLAETATSMEDASEDTARLSIAATALVHVISDCDMVLQLRDVTVKESDPNSPSMRSAPESSRAAALLERQPLRFSFQDGVVEELCPSEEEELWALNVKRGVLSAFQNSMARLDSDQTVTEVDVAGSCPSQYHVQNKGWYSTTVKRSKDLLACTDRHDYQTAVHASPYNVQSSVQSLPLMKSTHECEQTVNQYGVLSSATCTESHMFRPFSREASGAVTKVSQSLKYKTQSRSRVNIQPVSQRVSLMFQHGNKEEITRKAQQEAEEVLRQLCRNTQTDIRPDTPRLFSSLVSAMRRVDTSGLQALYSKLEQNTLCANNIRTKKFFVDALPMVGTDAAVTMMTQLLTGNDVTGIEAEMWVTSLALIQEPTSAMLRQVQSLLKSQTLQEKALLPVSTMINNFCQRHPHCSLEASVQSIMTSFEDVIGSSCNVNKRNLDQVLMGLRAIGNAGHVSSSISVVNKCLKRDRNPLEVRVAAAQAFRRMPCDADRTAVTFIMEDSQEDSELRIAAYLALMTCPDDVTLQRVQLLLETEVDQQVGSFVWSHLTNLQETSSPHKQAVRDLLKNVQLPAKYDLGRLQFSRNYEGSAFLKRLNSGAAAEGNLVWSSSSSLPRSVSANMTVDLFGRSLNLVDFGLRMEGLEYLLETMLGPYGYFGQSGKDSKGTSRLDELKGSLYLRMFGNEMTFQRFQGLDSLNSATSFNMLDFLIKLSKNHDIAMTHSTEFLDTQMTVPTSCGLPLSLTVKGTATVDLKASGKIDLRKVSATPRSLQVYGEIRPSGAIRVSGQMSVDAQVSRAALHVTGTLHSSTALKARVDLDRGRVMSMELNVPEDKIEIFDISSEFSIVHNTVEKKQKMISDNRKTIKMCTGDLTSRITGLELCGELQYPNASTRVSGPYFPLTGPSSLSVALYKRDTHTSYKLLAKRVENKKKTMAQLSFNTPGSKVDRSLAFDLVINHEDKQLEVSAASPWKKAEFRGAITNTKKLMGVSGSYITDDVNVYSVRTEVKVDESKNGVTYTPVVEFRCPHAENVALTGLVSMETKSATVDLTLTGVTRQPLTLKSAFTNTKKEVSLTGSVAKGDKQQYSLRVGSQMNIATSKKAMKFQVTPFLSVKSPKQELVSFSGSALYTQDRVLKTDFTFSLLNFRPLTAQLTATKSARKTSVRYISKVNVKSSVLTGSMSGTVNVKKGRLINSRVTVAYNVPRVARDKLVLMSKLSDRSTKAYNKYTVTSSLDSKSFPDYNTAVQLSMDHKKKLSSGALEVRYGKNPKDKTKRVSVSATLARKVKNLKNVDLSYKMAAEAPEQNINFRIRGQHEHDPTGLESNVILSYAKGKDVSAALTLKDKSSKLKKLNGELTLKGLGSGFTLKSGLTQASRKQWEHSMDLKTAGSKHSINTVYKNRGGNSHEVTSTVDVDGVKPIVLSGEANLDWGDLQMAGSVKQGKNTYGVSGSHKLAKSRNGKWSLEVTVPSRRVMVNADAGKVKGNYEGSVEVAWDADNDKNAKVALEGMAGSKSSKDFSSHKARLSLTTPLEGYSTMAASLGLDRSSSQHQLNTKLVLGDKKKVITTNLVVAAPFTPRDIDVTFKAETPFRGYGSMGVSLRHKLDSTLDTKLVVSLQKDQCEISLTAKNRGTDVSRDLQAELNVKSSTRWSGLKSLSVSATHKDDGRQFANRADVKVNSEAYSYLMNMQVDTGSNTGDITLTWPKDQMKTTWSHSHSSSDFHSVLTTVWASDKRVQVDVRGGHVPGSVSGSLAVQSPWRDWRAETSTQYGAGKVLSSSFVKKDNREAFTHNLDFTADASKTDIDFSMTSPWTEPISSKVNAKYEGFPMTGNAEFSWAPRKKVTAESSVVLNNWDDLDMSMRVTTPARAMRVLAAQVSSRVESGEVVSQLNVDLGMRKNVVLTTRVQRDVSGVRVKLTTPWNELRVVDTGIETSIQSAAGKVKADFKAVPSVGQYEATATWNAEDDLNARLRVATPWDDFPYLQIVASSKDKRRVRHSRVELEYSPRQTYSLDSTYSFELPLVLDINVATPLSGYESLSASFRHNMRDTAMDASAQVMYTNDQAIKATAMMDWSRGLDSSLTVTTPFGGWEQSSATLRHEGDMDDFNSLADVTVGGQGVTGSLKFFNKMTTDAQLSISTPWAGWEKIEAAVSRKGDLTNLRGTATLVYSGQKMEANVMNKWNSRKARMIASLSTPYTQDVKVSFEQTADLRTDASVSYGRQYSVDTSSNAVFNSRETSASTTIKYRVGGPRHLVTASVAKVGSLQDLAVTATTSLDKQEVSLTAELNTLRDIKAALALRTPFSQYESLGVFFHNSGDLTGMTTEANVEYMTDRNINGKMELSFLGLDQLSFRSTLTSPLSGLERSVVSLSHSMGPKMCSGSFNLDTTVGHFGTLDASYQKTGHVNNMKAESRLTYNSQSLLDASLTHKLTSSRLQTSLRVLTSDLPELNVEVNHQGDIRRFTTKASASAGGDKVSSDTRWSMSEDNMDLSQTFFSNLQGDVNKATIVLSKVGPLSDVTLQLSGNVNADKARIVGKLATVRDLSASLEVETPVDGFRQLGASVQKTGDASDLSVTAAANLERQKIEVVSKYTRGDEVTGSIDVTTPFPGYTQMGAAFSYGGQNAVISGNLQDDKIEATGRFVNDNIIEGNIDVTTPFDGYRQMGAALSYTGENAKFSGNLQDDKIEATGRLVYDDTIEGNIEIKTPFDGYRQMATSFNYGSNSVTASANLHNEKVEAIVKFDNADDVTGSLEIVTPFTGYTQLGGQFHCSGDMSDLTVVTSGHVENSKVEMTGKFSRGQDISGSVDITTPFRGYRTLGTSFALTADLNLLLAAHLMQDKLEARAAFSNKEAVTGSVSIATPFEGFRQVGATFKHTGSADNFNCEGQVTYMDGQVVSGKVSFNNYRLRRIETSAELRTPFTSWEMTKLSYTHAGNANKFECNAKLEYSRGHRHTVDLKVDMRRDQNVQLTVKTPYDGFRMTEVTHSLSQSDRSVQWSGTVTYGEGQRASSQLTVSYPDDRFSSRFDLQTPFTSDLTATFDFQGVLSSFTRKQTIKYGQQFQYADDLEFQINDTPLLLVNEAITYSIDDVSRSHSLYLRREGPWNDVTLAAKGELSGEMASMDATFKNEFGRIEGNVKVATPFEGYSDVGASFQHIGELSSAFSTEATVEYMDGQQIASKLDFMRASWRRLELTAELTTPFDDWTQTRAEYRHNADNDGFTCYADAHYLGDQRLTGDLRVTSSPNPEVTLTVKTPWNNWEQMSASGTYQNDGWGKREVSSKVDLGQGYIYTVSSALSGSEDAGKSISARLTTPHGDWHTLEARVSHVGSLEDFKSSAYLSTPLLDAVSASASLRYRSPFDLTAAGTVDTPFEVLKDWKMEIVNGERGSQKTSHVILGWSGDQEIVMDGTWRHDSSWYERHLHTDISLTSPFQALRQTSWVLEHQATQGRYEQKMTGSLNGDNLIDLDLATLTGDLPQVTVTLNEPRVMQYSLARTSEGADLSLDWDRNDPNSNLRLTSRFTDSSDSDGFQHDLDLKVIHPSRTVGAKYNLQVSPQNAASQGELYWGRGSNRRVFYTLDLTDLSRRSSTNYEGKVKVGVFSRAVQLSGSVSQSPVSRQMDAMVHWDADRDQTKQVALKTRWSSGEKNKADLTLSLPAINQEVRVQSEVAVNQGRTLLDATTALSYSQDSSKVLTFSSTLQDTTGAWDSGSNYTLQLTLTHPHTDLDVSMTSHLGASDDRYSAAIDTWYLTSRRQRKNMALRGEIDQLRRQLTMEMVSPVKKVVMKGQVKSVEPYSLSLTNRYDDDATFQADVTLDTNKRSVTFKTNYDLEHPERSLVLKALYVNDTAIRAEVYRDYVTDVITDALLALRLNTSTILHSRLHWRSASLRELQDYSVAKLSSCASRSKQSMKSVSDAVRDELAARYSRSAAALAQDLTPWMELVDNEMKEVASQLQSLRRQLNRFYRRHPFLKDMGTAVSDRFLALQAYVGEVADSYQQKAEAVSQQMKEAVQSMAQYPVGEHYQQSVHTLLQAVENVIDRGVKQLTQTVVSLDNYLLAARQRGIHVSNVMSEAAHNVTQHPYILYLRNSLDLSPYVEAATNKLSALRMPEEYTAAIYDASARANGIMSDVMEMEAMKRFKEASNAAYQEGLWAYNYWQVEENLNKHLHSIATLLEEIVEDELAIYTRHFRFLQKSHVTVWDPEHGEIQAELHLPVAMETLDSMPDVTPLVMKYNEAMSALPDMDTVQYFYDQYVPKNTWWSDNSTEQGQLMAELNESTPTRRQTRLLRKRNHQRRRTVANI